MFTDQYTHNFIPAGISNLKKITKEGLLRKKFDILIFSSDFSSDIPNYKNRNWQAKISNILA